jgi:hypothetical protein
MKTESKKPPKEVKGTTQGMDTIQNCIFLFLKKQNLRLALQVIIIMWIVNIFLEYIQFNTCKDSIFKNLIQIPKNKKTKKHVKHSQTFGKDNLFLLNFIFFKRPFS